MIVVDTSAVIAIFAMEADAPRIAACIVDAGDVRMSAATVLEASVVLRSSRFNTPPIGEEWLDGFLARAEVSVEPVTVEQARIARAAHRQFGKGSGHSAQLNFGDCFAYALAKALDAPLLYKGDDFSRTDIRSALA